jgi:hypothetical protein
MAAGNWLTTAGLGDAYIAVARRSIELALSDTVKNREVMGHPVILGILAADEALGQLLGELGVSVSLLTLGAGKMTAVAEGTTATATSFSTSNTSTISPGRRAYARTASDFARSIGEPMLRGQLSPSIYAMMIYEAMRVWFNDWLDRILALATTATYTIGSTGVDLTFEALDDGIVDFKNRGAGEGPAIGFLDAKGIKDLNADARSLGGAVQFSQEAAAGITRLGGGAFVGTRNGVEFYLNGELDASGGDTYGLILTTGAVMSKHQRVPLPPEADLVADLGMVTIEAKRGAGGTTLYEMVSHNAVGWREQARAAALVYVT